MSRVILFILYFVLFFFLFRMVRNFFLRMKNGKGSERVNYRERKQTKDKYANIEEADFEELNGETEPREKQ